MMKPLHTLILIVLIALALFTHGCVTQIPEGQAVYRLSPSSYPKFEDDMLFDGLERSIDLSISYLKKIPSGRTFKFGPDTYTADHLSRSLEYFLSYIKTQPSKKELKKFIRSNYLVYKSVGRNQKGEVLFTGYYEPFLQGRTEKNHEFRYPVWSLPGDMIHIDLGLFSSKFEGEKIIGRLKDQSVIPYHDRQEIEQGGALEGKAAPLAWVKDPVALFFLHIQGSGRIFLNNGKVINVHYHGTNGRPYRSIGKLLIQRANIDPSEMSMQKIREYLAKHPKEIDPVLNHNPSYVFFKTEEEGPLGCLNVKLTPGRSIALDRRIFPLPALAFIKTQKPLVNGTSAIAEWIDFSRFVVTQDTGGAIRGPGRSDLYWGNGDYAEIAAGHMKHTGELYLLVLKSEP